MIGAHDGRQILDDETAVELRVFFEGVKTDAFKLALKDQRTAMNKKALDSISEGRLGRGGGHAVAKPESFKLNLISCRRCSG